ncbi:MAG: immunoglobulin domain-containing protein [Opitutaceae bacterium]|nr:immunoglobulin domain-containing protein [Opitutaceae bacterium]
MRPAGCSAPSHRIFHILKLGFALGLISCLTAVTSKAVDATLTPSTTSSTATTPVVLHVTGLSNGGSVIVERYVDADADGVVDVGEFLAETYTVTDGQVTSIGGVRNTNMPGDEDLPADGQISINVLPTLGSELGRVAGSHLIRISSPLAAFTTFIRTLTLTNPAQAQSISGTVTDGTDPVPYASVILLDAATDGEFAIGVITNASGVYTAPAPAGSYMVLPFKFGYVASFPSPTVLAAAATPTQNLVMTAATRSISGEVADAGTNAGLGGVQLFVQSMSDQVTIISTAADGTYSVPVTAGNWEIETSETSLRQLGYLNNDNGSAFADTSVGSVTNANINVTPATALIHGTVEDASANPLAGIRMNANDSNFTYYSDAITDASGHYVLGATTGTWNVNVSNENPGLTGFIIPNGESVAIAGAEAIQTDFSLVAVNAHLIGTVTNTGAPVPAIRIGAYNQITNQFVMVETAVDGTFDLGLVAGTWSLQIESSSATSFNIVSPSINYTLAVDETIAAIEFPVLPATAQISGIVQDGDNSNQPIGNASVFATATIGSVLYNASAQTDGSGNYSLPVANGTWQVGVFANGYTSPGSVAENVSGSNITRDFILTQKPVIGLHPSDHTATAGQTFVFSISANGSGVSYQWEVSSNDGVDWDPLVNGGAYSTVTSNVLNITAEIGLDGYRYRCIATNGFGSAASNSALLTVNAANIAPSFSVHPSNQTVTAGQNASFNVSASGTPAPTFQWEESTDDGNSWNNLAEGAAYNGVTSTTLTVTSTLVGQDGHRYRAVATNAAGSATSNVAILTVNPPDVAPSITADPSNQTVTAGQNASFSVSANGSPSPTFQWQVSIDSGSNWTDLSDDANYSGTATGMLQVTATTIGQNGHFYRAVATNVAGFANSNSALLTVNAANVAPSITADPANQTVTAGQNAVFSVTADGTPAPTYQWEVSTDGGSNWSTLANDANYSDVTTTTLTVTATIVGQNTYRFRAVATNVAGFANSNSALLTVNAANVAPGITANPANQTVTAGQNASFTVSASGSPAPTYQWEVSTDGGTNWTSLTNDATYSGVTTTTLTVTSALIGLDGNLYRAAATNIAGSASSNGAVLTVNAVSPLTTLHHFNIATDAGNPSVSESLTRVGTKLYGTTYGGGTNFEGTLFSINTNGSGFALMHSFTDLSPEATNADGKLPISTLTLADGKLYGTATAGGSLGNGTLYSINPDGTGFTTLVNFTGTDPTTSNAKHSPWVS